MSHANRDAVLRMALAAMAADRRSSLTLVQRQWVLALVQRTRPLTTAERLKLKAPLLTWMQENMPRCVPLLERQYI